jgi:hypothetical protein
MELSMKRPSLREYRKCYILETNWSFRQKHTAWSDGVPGLTQWAIQPNYTFDYQWHATQYGTYWYHSHDMATIQDGLYGAIQIRYGS